MSTTTTTSLPSNVHLSTHPCLIAKLSQLRSHTTNARDAKALVHEIALIIGCQALATSLYTTPISTPDGQNVTPLGYSYSVESIAPQVVLVPILRSGLGMLEALQTLLPNPAPVHHLGLFRDPISLAPVEYYNNLPSLQTPPPLAIVLDPIIATGGTAVAAIQTLHEWGVEKVLLLSVLGCEVGVRRAAAEEGGGAGGSVGARKVEVWLGAVDERMDNKGMIVPGLGDVGDRLFMTTRN